MNNHQIGYQRSEIRTINKITKVKEAKKTFRTFIFFVVKLRRILEKIRHDIS